MLLSGSLDRSVTLAVETSDGDAEGKTKDLGCMLALKCSGIMHRTHCNFYNYLFYLP